MIMVYKAVDTEPLVPFWPFSKTYLLQGEMILACQGFTCCRKREQFSLTLSGGKESAMGFTPPPSIY